VQNYVARRGAGRIHISNRHTIGLGMADFNGDIIIMIITITTYSYFKSEIEGKKFPN
jgi:hypothetical protein